MMGREKCELLKQIRREIAERNGIEYLHSDCTYEGECSGTCPKCEAEIRYLDAEINRKVENGEKVHVAGISPDLLSLEWEEKVGSADVVMQENRNEINDISRECEMMHSPEKMSIEELDFSVRTHQCLKRVKITTVEQLEKCSEEDLIKIPHMNCKGIKEISDKLESIGISLRTE